MQYPKMAISNEGSLQVALESMGPYLGILKSPGSKAKYTILKYSIV